MLATLVDKPFNNKDWVFEVKWDGIRSIFYVYKTKNIFQRFREDKSPEDCTILNSKD